MNGIGSTIHFPPFKAITEIDFCAWLAQAEPGEVLQYHRGFLCLDRGAAGPGRRTASQRQLNQLAERAYDLAEQGLVHLVQRRLGKDSFSYLAIARPRSNRTPVPFQTLMSEEAA